MTDQPSDSETAPETLFERVLRHEGYKELPYLDTLDNWTVGIGHWISPDQAKNQYKDGISLEDATALCEQDLRACQAFLQGTYPFYLSLTQLRQEVMQEMAFQLGVDKIKDFEKMLNAIREQNWDDAAQEMLDSLWHKETPQRVEELAGLMIKG